MKGANYLVRTFCTSLKNQVVVEVFFESLDQTAFRNRNEEGGGARKISIKTKEQLK